MTDVSLHAVRGFRMRRQHLIERAPAGYLLEVVEAVHGIQAQISAHAQFAVAQRIEGCGPAEIDRALWTDKSLIKTWAMRGTLHLLSTEELPLFVAARSRHDSRNWAGYFAYYGLTPAQQEAFLAAVPHVLGSEPMTRQQLADTLVSHTGISALRELIVSSGWGSPLKPSAFRGDLCFGPSQGQNVTGDNAP